MSPAPSATPKLNAPSPLERISELSFAYPKANVAFVSETIVDPPRTTPNACELFPPATIRLPLVVLLPNASEFAPLASIPLAPAEAESVVPNPIA